MIFIIYGYFIILLHNFLLFPNYICIIPLNLKLFVICYFFVKIIVFRLLIIQFICDSKRFFLF